MTENMKPSKAALVEAVRWIMSLPKEQLTGYTPPGEQRPRKPTSKRGDSVDSAP